MRSGAAGGTVAWVVPAAPDRMVVPEEFFGPEMAAMFRRSGGGGPVAGRLWEGFEVHPDDLLAEKTAFSAFFPGRCTLPSLLAERGITTVLITGTVKNVCCESSARDASTLGYRSFGDVRPAAEVIAMIESAAG
jgi:nicotinamidase-related amidase